MTSERPDIEQAVAENRRRMIAAIERPLVRTLSTDYRRILDVLDGRVATMLERIAAEQGGRATVAQMIADARYDAVQAQVAAEMRAAAMRTGTVVTAAERAAVRLGAQDASGLMQQVAMRPSALTMPSIQNMIAALVDPSPLVDLVRTLPGQAQAAVRGALIDGVAAGDNPRITARAVRRAANMPASRALNIARTETHRAVRGAALETYRANADVIEGWVWISAADSRTCAVCWSMHGSIFPLDEPLASHPQCRCSQGPMPRSHDPALRPDVVRGEERFRRLDPATQRDILGPARADAYQDGRLTLGAMVGFRRDPRWGGTRFVKPLARSRR